ncbi:MAG: hypothetical protein J0M36_10195 [Caulobacterales bacterium]|nr:hypothetical protein [Caulobacterales bacterium]
MGRTIRRLKAFLNRRSALIGRFTFELVVVGVTGAFALENVRQDAEEAASPHGDRRRGQDLRQYRHP